MKGFICLIKLPNQKVVPALCLKDNKGDLLFAQIRSGSLEDQYTIQTNISNKNLNKDKSNKDNSQQTQKAIVYIGQLEGLKSESVVMVKKIIKVQKENVIKQIAEVSENKVNTCLHVMEQIQTKDQLHQELHRLKN